MLIAVSGFSGAGKTTAVKHLEAMGIGRVIYAGGLIREEVRRRGLPETPENEQAVRLDMRQRQGNDVLAKMVVSRLGDAPLAETVMLDAICGGAEVGCYRQRLGSGLVVLSLDASFEIRAARLEKRPERPLTRPQLRDRDTFELVELKMDEVSAAADCRLTNEGDLASFKRELDALSGAWRRDA